MRCKICLAGAACRFAGVGVSVGAYIAPNGGIPIMRTVTAVGLVAVLTNCFFLASGGAAVAARCFGMRCVEQAGAGVGVIIVVLGPLAPSVAVLNRYGKRGAVAGLIGCNYSLFTRCRLKNQLAVC